MQDNPTPRETEGIPDFFSYPITETVRLVEPTNLEPIDLWDVVVKRKSVRDFQKLSIEQISQVLWLSAKVDGISLQSNGYVLSHRRSASAGARHPIDIIVLSPILEESKCLYYYNAFEHTLNKLLLNIDLIEKLVEHFNSIIDINASTIFWFVAHVNRTETKYDNPLSLIWRDAGALLHSVQIACTGLGFNSCPLGSLGEPYVTELFGFENKVISAGGIAVG